MKALLAFFALTAALHAQSPIVIYPPVSQATVISPLTNAPAQSNQALLNQISNTISRRYFEHQALTLTQPAAQPVFSTNLPRVIRAK